MLKRLRKINKANLIKSSRRMAEPVIPLPMAYAALLGAGVPKDKAVLMVQDAATRFHSDDTNLGCVVAWASTPYSAEWCAAAESQ